VIKRLRVTHVVETLELGGMEKMVATLCLNTNTERFDVSVLCLKREGAIAEELRAKGIRVGFAQIPVAPPEYAAFRRVTRYLRLHPSDVLHTHNTSGLLNGVLGGRLAGVRTIVHTEHGRSFPDHWRYMLLERCMAKLIYRFVGVSEETTRALHTFEGISMRRLRTIPNGVDEVVIPEPDELFRLREQLSIPTDALIVGAVARLVWEKSLKDLLSAFRLVVNQEPRAILLIAGDGPQRDELHNCDDTKALGDRVRFLGTRLDVGRLLHIFDVYCLSSVSEGLPLGLLEAMSSGRAIVSTDVGGIPSAITHMKEGLLVPPRQPQLFAQAVITLLRNTALAASLGAAARETFEARYTSSAMARAYESMYLRQNDEPRGMR